MEKEQAMDHREVYPLRVQRCEDGAYRWRGEFDRAQYGQVVKITMGTCGGTCLVFVVMALVLGDMLGVVLLTCLAIMAIAGGVCWAYMRFMTPIYQPYELTEDYVRYVGSRRSNTYFRYKDIRKVIIDAGRGRIAICSALVTAPVFVPREDFAFVQNYILQRLPDTAQIIYR